MVENVTFLFFLLQAWAMPVRLASWIIRDIEQASLYGRLLHVANPVCAADVFTDRWPESIA
ncbi:hypothetical protein SAMN04487972_13029 [Paracoccus halophilus]|uniref:Uncharacterized protein n=1 Tax=Paracoccus halophilus TaxID=376733 RepID=A0A099EW98_9RHOB|nr:hypothetical protein [Paracoccus halophilus]KGJ02675.1 hypothetical protein IT41_16665 [Paracoccus halophilus]SFA60708.1 hypothetical protein SAMN04487972_13029 [Paracoccus halophilus]